MNGNEQKGNNPKRGKRDLLNLDLGSLLRGKVQAGPPPAWRRYRSQVRNLRQSRARFITGPLFFPFRLLGVLLGFFGGFVQAQRHIRLIMITEQLQRIVACNAPMVPALDAVMTDVPSARMWRAIRNLRINVAAGLSLSEAMRSQPRVFPTYYADLVKAGEESGRLEHVFDGLRKNLEASVLLRDSGRRILAYVVVLYGFALLMMAFMATRVMPVFAEIMADFGEEMPWFVKGHMDFLETLSGFFVGGPERQPQWGNIGALILIIAVLLYLWRSGRIGRMWGAAGQYLPFARRLVVEANLAHAAQILQQLLKAGYPVDEALESTAQADLRTSCKAALGRMRERVRQGEPLSQAAEREQSFLPASFRGMVSVGETSGCLPEALDRIAHHYRQRVLRAGHWALGALFPVCIVFMGFYVLIVNLSLYGFLAGMIDVLIAQM